MKKVMEDIGEEKEQRNRRSFEGKYTSIEKDGKTVDILFLFGSWVGHRLSDILEDPTGYNYIYGYVLSPERDFPKPFKDLVRKAAEQIEAEMGDYSPDVEDEDIPF